MSHTPEQRTRIKICGLTSIADALEAVSAGADAIGLVFHKASPRFISINDAVRIRRHLPAFITVTALCMDETEDEVAEIVRKVDPDCMQFHGSESAEFCAHWNKSYIKAIPMGSVDDANAYAVEYHQAQGFLLDSNVAGRQGGSGDTFDWSKIPSTIQYPLILAGGLTPQNVAEAVRQVHPYAVDVSSGVESSRGVKDAQLIRQFCKEVMRVDCQH